VRNDLAEEYLQHVVDRVEAWGGRLNITTEVSLSAETGEAIVESCDRHVADLIVMATHGRGASRLLVGAVGDRVLRDGPDAALFIRPDEDRLPAGLMIPESERAGHDAAIDDAEHPLTVVR
jgi:nucleotide-binding universal stress UspA family protein